jgi:hypothetical protein
MIVLDFVFANARGTQTIQGTACKASTPHSTLCFVARPLDRERKDCLEFTSTEP